MPSTSAVCHALAASLILARRGERGGEERQRRRAVDVGVDRALEARLGLRVVAGRQKRDALIERGLDARAPRARGTAPASSRRPPRRAGTAGVSVASSTGRKSSASTETLPEPFGRRQQHLRRRDLEAARQRRDRGAAGRRQDRAQHVLARRQRLHRHHLGEDHARVADRVRRRRRTFSSAGASAAVATSYSIVMPSRLGAVGLE